MPSVKWKKLRYLPYFPKNYWHNAVKFALRQQLSGKLSRNRFLPFSKMTGCISMADFFIQNLFRCFADSLSWIVVRRRNGSAFTHKAAKIDHQQKK